MPSVKYSNVVEESFTEYLQVFKNALAQGRKTTTTTCRKTTSMGEECLRDGGNVLQHSASAWDCFYLLHKVLQRQLWDSLLSGKVFHFFFFSKKLEAQTWARGMFFSSTVICMWFYPDCFRRSTGHYQHMGI